MLRIGIDYRFAAKTVRGIGVYIREIVRELMLIDTTNLYTLYLDQEISLNLPSNFTIKLMPQTNILWFEQVSLPRQAKYDKLDVLWYPSNSGAVFLDKKIKQIVTIHDLIVFSDANAVENFKLSSFKHRAGEYYRRYALKRGLERIDQITTVSEYSAREIKSLLHRNSVVIPNQVSNKHPGSEGAIFEKLRIKPGEYLFSMTGKAPHKNLNGLLNIFSSLDIPHKLVISGTDKPVDFQEELAERVIFTGYITEEEKAGLYSNASIFLFLSLYEGFGIPILEAMQHQTPIVASNRSSIPEVLGEGGFLVNPEDTLAVKMTILRILDFDYEKEALKSRQKLQLEKFCSWEGSARKLLDVIENFK